MASNSCLICGKKFYAKPSHIMRGWGKYCSIVCRNKSQFIGVKKYCLICKKEIYRTPGDIRKSKSGKFFCSKSCQTNWRNSILYVEIKHKNWKNGESAFRRILSNSNKLKICVLCKIDDFRVLSVHHIDKNRKNNKISNLIWVCQNCHYLILHHKSVELTLMTSLNMVAVVQK